MSDRGALAVFDAEFADLANSIAGLRGDLTEHLQCEIKQDKRWEQQDAANKRLGDRLNELSTEVARIRFQIDETHSQINNLRDTREILVALRDTVEGNERLQIQQHREHMDAMNTMVTTNATLAAAMQAQAATVSEHVGDSVELERRIIQRVEAIDSKVKVPAKAVAAGSALMLSMLLAIGTIAWMAVSDRAAKGANAAFKAGAAEIFKPEAKK